MRANKISSRAAALVLVAVMLILPAGAIKLVGSANIYSKLGIDTTIAAGLDLSENDAAMRLYYLGMLTGNSTNMNGGIEFNLDNGLKRIESAVFAVRLLGAEEEAEREHYPHPFIDVPEWASDYIGYLCEAGVIIDDDEKLFYPDRAETTENFMSYCLYALGYRISDGDYTVLMAAEYARDAGICITEKDAPLTRGGAVTAMYNTLRATMKDSTRVYSDLLVERGAVSYNDAVFLLWNRKRNETDEYMSAAGYANSWIIPDGYYTIKAGEGETVLNVAVSGVNNDYEGVGITTWQSTGDVSQTFRIQRTERGTYYIYSAASRNGYGRVIGSGYGDAVGLYSSTWTNAMEFNICYASDGLWYIYSAEQNDNRCLSVNDTASSGEPVILAESGKAASQTWVFNREGIVNSSGEEMAMFVANSLVITQGAYDVYSHMNQNAVDMQPTEGAVKAPFNATVVQINPTYISCNAVWIQSNEKVHYADGSYDYMTLCFMHDDDISDIYVGRTLTQGEYFYNSGTYGWASGSHVHMAIYRGQYNTYMQVGNGDVYAEDALFLPDDVYIYNNYGLTWNMIGLAD